MNVKITTYQTELKNIIVPFMEDSIRIELGDYIKTLKVELAETVTGGLKEIADSYLVAFQIFYIRKRQRKLHQVAAALSIKKKLLKSKKFLIKYTIAQIKSMIPEIISIIKK